MTQFQCSDKLARYLTRVERETGRTVELRFVTDLELPGANNAFALHPSSIIILLRKGIDWGSPEHESSIAHKATHGYLIYKLGYSYLTTKSNSAENETVHIRLPVTMIDDIVVNSIVQREGFSPFARGYLDMVQKETEAPVRVVIDHMTSIHTTFCLKIGSWSFVIFLRGDLSTTVI